MAKPVVVTDHALARYNERFDRTATLSTVAALLDLASGPVPAGRSHCGLPMEAWTHGDVTFLVRDEQRMRVIISVIYSKWQFGGRPAREPQQALKVPSKPKPKGRLKPQKRERWTYDLEDET